MANDDDSKLTHDEKDEANRVTFKEFIAICLAQYRIAFLEMGLMLAAILIVYFLVVIFWG